MGGCSFWSNVIDVLYTFCMFISISFFRLGKFSGILLRIFSGHWSWDSSFLSIPIVLRFGLFMASQIFWMFVSEIFLGVTFSLTVVSMSSIVCLKMKSHS